MSSSSVSFVIAGPPASGKKSLLEGIVQLNAGFAESKPEYVEKVFEGKNVLTTAVTLSTKYYTAEIEARILPSDEFHKPGDCARAVLEGAEALLLMVDASRTETFNQVASWSAVVEEISPPTMLLIINKLDVVTGRVPGSEDESALTTALGSTEYRNEALSGLLSSMSDWSLDNGFEHVECAASSPWVGASSREKTSVARVLEALQSTMWSNMSEKAMPDPIASAAARLRHGPAGTADVEKFSAAADSFIARSVGTAEENSVSQDDELIRKVKSADVAGEDDLAEDAEDEQDLDVDGDLMRLMDQMRSVRTNAQTGNLSDEARRDAAARMAMMLMSFVEKMGGDDEEEGDA